VGTRFSARPDRP